MATVWLVLHVIAAKWWVLSDTETLMSAFICGLGAAAPTCKRLFGPGPAGCGNVSVKAH